METFYTTGTSGAFLKLRVQSEPWKSFRESVRHKKYRFCFQPLFFLHRRSRISPSLYPGLLHLLGHGNPTNKRWQKLFHYRFSALMAQSVPL